MKKIIAGLLVLCALTMVYSCKKRGELPAELKLSAELIKDTTEIEYLDSTVYYFDTIQQGDKVEHTFRILNKGPHNFIIAHAAGSCGCTVPDYPKEPVKPGDTAVIHVTFNSAGKEMEQSKSVTLTCNTLQHSEMLYLKGYVQVKK